MSLYKIDGHILTVNDLYKWIGSFVTLYRKGKIHDSRVPADILEALKHSDDEKAVEAVLAHLRNDEEFIGELINTVREIFPEVADELRRKTD